MAQQSSKELVKGLFQYRPLPRSPFIPWVCRFAAQLEQVSVRDMLSDAGALSSALLNAQQLFGYDAIISAFDLSLEAEACGCEVAWGEEGDPPEVVSHPLASDAAVSLPVAEIEQRGRIPVVLDAARRTIAVRGKQVPVFAVVTGPLALGAHLRGEAFLQELELGSDVANRVISLAADIILRLSRRYCELGVDAIVVADELLGQVSPGRIQALAAPLKTVWNVARYFGAGSLILSKGCSKAHVGPVLALGADGVALSGGIDRACLRAEAALRKACWAWPVVAGPFQGNDPPALPAAGEPGCFLSTEWEVPFDADVEAMHEVMNAIRGE